MSLGFGFLSEKPIKWILAIEVIKFYQVNISLIACMNIVKKKKDEGKWWSNLIYC